MNDREIRQRLRGAIGEFSYPPDLSARTAARLRQPLERQPGSWILAAVGAVLAVAVVAAIFAGGYALRAHLIVPVKPPTIHAPAAAPCPNYTQLNQQVPALKMSSPTTGWAAGGLKTTDGGATWRDMSPGELRAGMPAPAVSNALYPPGFKDFYLDADHAWEFRTYASTTTCIDHAAVFATSDGGRTWRASQTISFGLPPAWGGVTMDFQFVDASHGWVLIAAGRWQLLPGGWGDGVAAPEDLLYATSDGGLTWRLVSTLKPAEFGTSISKTCPFGLGGLTFTASDKGWMEVDCAGQSPELLVTTDGGVTWAPKAVDVGSFSSLCPCSTQFEHVFDSGHLILNVIAGNTALTLVTSDGGKTWQTMAGWPPTGTVIVVDYLNFDQWWAVVTEPSWQKGTPTHDWLYRTTDSGRSWTLVATGLPLGFPVDQLAFVDDVHGLALQSPGASTGPPLGPGEEVLVTSDGGRTWKKVADTVRPSP